jgi:hypothetical protein
MVLLMAPNSYRFASYGYQKLDQFNESEFWTDLTFRSKSGFGQIFAMTSPETLNTKVTINELSFPLVTHTTFFDARFDSYVMLMSGQGAEHLLDRLDILRNDQVLRAEDT